MSLKYLVTILYQPRETMQKILAGAQRWSWEITALACICASVNEINADRAARELPGLRLAPGLALVALGLIGCSMIAVYLLFQVLFAIWCIVIGSFTVAEAEKFSADKGFVSIVSALVLPF